MLVKSLRVEILKLGCGHAFSLPGLLSASGLVLGIKTLGLNRDSI